MTLNVGEIVITQRGIVGKVVKTENSIVWLKLKNRDELYTCTNQHILRKLVTNN